MTQAEWYSEAIVRAKFPRPVWGYPRYNWGWYVEWDWPKRSV
jgi:hypothetical protein